MFHVTINLTVTYTPWKILGVSHVTYSDNASANRIQQFKLYSLREKCPNTDLKKLHIWTLFTQWLHLFPNTTLEWHVAWFHNKRLQKTISCLAETPWESASMHENNFGNYIFSTTSAIAIALSANKVKIECRRLTLVKCGLFTYAI